MWQHMYTDSHRGSLLFGRVGLGIYNYRLSRSNGQILYKVEIWCQHSHTFINHTHDQGVLQFKCGYHFNDIIVNKDCSY